VTTVPCSSTSRGSNSRRYRNRLPTRCAYAFSLPIPNLEGGIKMGKWKCRKAMRLKDGDYNGDSVVFLTICTKERRCILSRIVGTGVLDGPHIELTQYGIVADKYINQLNQFYDNLQVEAYVIMPNHIHMMLCLKNDGSGPSGTPVPTIQNTITARFLSTFKRFCNKECGMNIWQYRSYDHIIRNEQDYDEHIKYIFENPTHWRDDRLYAEG